MNLTKHCMKAESLRFIPFLWACNLWHSALLACQQSISKDSEHAAQELITLQEVPCSIRHLSFGHVQVAPHVA